MTEPQPNTIRGILAQSLIVQQETNELLRRIVPDDRVSPGGLYDMLRSGLYRTVPDNLIPGEFNYIPQPAMLYELLRNEENSLSIAQIASAISLNTANTNLSAAEAANNVLNLTDTIIALLSGGTLTLNIAEQLSVIRENSAALRIAIDGTTGYTNDQGIYSLLDRVGNLLLSVESTQIWQTADGSSYSTALLLYALGLCQCNGFPALPDPTIPPDEAQPSVFNAQCEDGQEAIKVRCTSVGALGQVTIGTTLYDRFFIRWTDGVASPGGRMTIRTSTTQPQAYRIQDTNPSGQQATLVTAFPNGLAPAIIQRQGAADVTSVSGTSGGSSANMPALPRGCNSQATLNLANPVEADPIWYALKIFYPAGTAPALTEMRHVYLYLYD